jgi:hypothetical protein
MRRPDPGELAPGRGKEAYPEWCANRESIYGSGSSGDSARRGLGEGVVATALNRPT